MGANLLRTAEEDVAQGWKVVDNGVSRFLLATVGVFLRMEELVSDTWATLKRVALDSQLPSEQQHRNNRSPRGRRITPPRNDRQSR